MAPHFLEGCEGIQRRRPTWASSRVHRPPAHGCVYIWCGDSPVLGRRGSVGVRITTRAPHNPSTSQSEHCRVRQSNYRITDYSLSSGCSLQHCNRLQPLMRFGNLLRGIGIFASEITIRARCFPVHFPSTPLDLSSSPVLGSSEAPRRLGLTTSDASRLVVAEGRIVRTKGLRHSIVGVLFSDATSPATGSGK